MSAEVRNGLLFFLVNSYIMFLWQSLLYDSLCWGTMLLYYKPEGRGFEAR
jgi:hypothetical protein